MKERLGRVERERVILYSGGIRYRVGKKDRERKSEWRETSDKRADVVKERKSEGKETSNERTDGVKERS